MFEKMPAEQISYIFENTEDAVCLVSSGGVLLEANPAAEKLFGISADSAIKIWDAIPFVEGNDDLIQLFIDAVAQKLKAQEEIVDYVSNDGTKYNLHVRLYYFKKDDYDSAKDYCEKVLAIDPNHGLAKNILNAIAQLKK